MVPRVEEPVTVSARLSQLIGNAPDMAILVVAGAAPAFAEPPEKWGQQCGGEKHSEPGQEKNGVKGDNNCGFHYSPDNR
jgi:hypothetical protein